jgi:prepilin-type N-terminal cleavage/methylation domain-containing protein
MSRPRAAPKRGFSLMELVIVAVIIGIIAAIAIPRLSRGTAGAADSALVRDLAVLRNAVEMFAAEHGGGYPTAARIAAQLTGYTDDRNTSEPAAKKDAAHPFGPYLQKIPPLPVGANAGRATFGGSGPSIPASFGWFYDEKTGKVRANCADTEVDYLGNKYNEY